MAFCDIKLTAELVNAREGIEVCIDIGEGTADDAVGGGLRLVIYHKAQVDYDLPC